MSFTDIKQAVDRMSEQDRHELTRYLVSRLRRDDAEWQAELDRRCDHVRAGSAAAEGDLLALDAKLRKEGR